MGLFLRRPEARVLSFVYSKPTLFYWARSSAGLSNFSHHSTSAPPHPPTVLRASNGSSGRRRSAGGRERVAGTLKAPPPPPVPPPRLQGTTRHSRPSVPSEPLRLTSPAVSSQRLDLRPTVKYSALHFFAGRFLPALPR
jgi:hypothetical protein